MDNKNLTPKNFIEEIIISDLEAGRVEKIATRFPPEPNGYLHIGHAKAILLNYGLAQKFGGTFNIRFDDTNPLKEDEEFCRAIVEDIRWLGCDGAVLYSSDYFEEMFDCADRLIQKGKAFVCALTSDQIREYRGTLTEPGKESPYRNRSIDENLKLFYEMRDGRHPDGSLTLRAKINMSSPNINMRDPVIYRVLAAHHHRQKDKWKIYPMYDFAHPIEDAVEKISHSICTLEFEDHRPLYDWVIREGGYVPAPHQYEFARLNITRTIMSKRYLKKLVDDKFVDGWDDPRMPTLAGFRRRGYPPEAIRDFCERVGVAKANSEVDGGMLEHCVRDVLNYTAPRVMAVIDPIKMVITNYPVGQSEKVELENNPNDETPTYRQVYFSGELYIEREDFMVNPPPKYHRLTPGGFVRLKGAYIVKCDRYELADDGRVNAVYCSYIPESRSGSDTSGLKVKGVIHWVSRAHAVDITVNRLDYLLNSAEGTNADFTDRLNKASKITYSAKAEQSLSNAAPLSRYQFIRQAYFSRDPKFKVALVFNEIVGLKESFKL